jgi:uridylate kinase
MPVKRILLKLSGESLSDGVSYISEAVLSRTVNEIKSVLSNEIQLAIVIGAGNIWRGANKFIERVAADKMGMLATVMNSLALRDALLKENVKSVVFSTIGVSGFVENFNIEEAIRYLENENVVIFAGGTGHPFFTTDTTAALRAAEIKADMLLKATQTDGIYRQIQRRIKML